MEAGAGEFYSGIIPIEWLKTYNMAAPINRREWLLSSCNICTYMEMKILSKMVQEYKIPVKITLNSHYYIPEQYKLLLDIMERLIDIGFDTFIISDLAFIMHLREKNVKCKIHLSGETEVINHLSMNFIEKYNITRYVFPRKITLNSMKEVIESFGKSEREFEAFVLNSFCQYSGGLCNSIHCDYLPTTCWLPNKTVLKNEAHDMFKNTTRTLKAIDRTVSLSKGKASIQKDYIFANSGCGICCINDLKMIGIEYLKVVGRGHELANLIEDVSAVKKITQDFVVCGKTKEDVIKEYHKEQCPERCYYTEKVQLI